MTVQRTTTWVDGNSLTAAALNGEFNNLLNAPAIVNADISGSAAINESKILFSGTGHAHTGTTDGKQLNLINILNTSTIVQANDSASITSDRAITGLTYTFTPSVACHAMVDVMVNLTTPASGRVSLILFVDGVGQSYYAQELSNNDNVTLNLTDWVALSAAQHTLTVHVSSQTGTATVNNNRAVMRVIVIN